MTEKVKLPKAVCDALDLAINKYQSKHSEVIYLIVRKAFYSIDSRLSVMNDQDADAIMRALVLGYEPERTADEQIKKLYQKSKSKRDWYEITFYRKGIVDTLDALGIHYDWLEDDAE